MENTHLERRVKSVLQDVEYLLDELIDEIETLEEKIETLENEIQALIDKNAGEDL